ncbi:hypothetical protein ACFXHC_20540 [Nocardia tengchongensis]|uniref:hypothetical protein n=1 Tax=Nocardia tengchongensis TaxID=2055889 RepID=UPI00368625A1
MGHSGQRPARDARGNDPWIEMPVVRDTAAHGPAGKACHPARDTATEKIGGLLRRDLLDRCFGDRVDQSFRKPLADGSRDESTDRPASGREQQLLRIDLATAAELMLIGLNSAVLQRTQRTADDRLLQREPHERDLGGFEPLLAEEVDGPSCQDADRDAPDADRRALRHRRGRREQPGRGDVGGQGDQRRIEHELRVFELGSGVLRGAGDGLEPFGELVDRLVADAHGAQLLDDLVAAVAGRIRLAHRRDGRIDVGVDRAQILGAGLPVVGDSPHRVLVAVRPFHADQPAEGPR